MTFKLILILVLLAFGNSTVAFTENDQTISNNAKGLNLRAPNNLGLTFGTYSILPNDITGDFFNEGLPKGSTDSTITTPTILSSINTDEIDQFIRLYKKLKAAGIFKWLI